LLVRCWQLLHRGGFRQKFSASLSLARVVPQTPFRDIASVYVTTKTHVKSNGAAVAQRMLVRAPRCPILIKVTPMLLNNGVY
jgi:hypothetical protein